MAVVQLHGADVGLQSVHGLVLLLVQHPEEERDGEGRGRREEAEFGCGATDHSKISEDSKIQNDSYPIEHQVSALASDLSMDCR